MIHSNITPTDASAIVSGWVSDDRLYPLRPRH